jgi:hypothetical protein
MIWILDSGKGASQTDRSRHPEGSWNKCLYTPYGVANPAGSVILEKSAPLSNSIEAALHLDKPRINP